MKKSDIKPGYIYYARKCLTGTPTKRKVLRINNKTVSYIQQETGETKKSSVSNFYSWVGGVIVPEKKKPGKTKLVFLAGVTDTTEELINQLMNFIKANDAICFTPPKYNEWQLSDRRNENNAREKAGVCLYVLTQGINPYHLYQLMDDCFHRPEKTIVLCVDSIDKDLYSRAYNEQMNAVRKEISGDVFKDTFDSQKNIKACLNRLGEFLN